MKVISTISPSITAPIKMPRYPNDCNHSKLIRFLCNSVLVFWCSSYGFCANIVAPHFNKKYLKHPIPLVAGQAAIQHPSPVSQIIQNLESLIQIILSNYNGKFVGGGDQFNKIDTIKC